MLGTIKAGAEALARALGVARWFQERATRAEQKQAGRAEAENEQRKEVIDARNRMDAVPMPDSESTRDRLRKGDF